MEEDRKIFSKILKEKAAKSGDNQVELAQMLGITRSAVNSYFAGTRMPTKDKMEKLAEHFGCTVAELEGEKIKALRSNSVKIPVLGTIPAGIPMEAVEDIIDYEEIPATMAKTGEFFCLRVKGDSMFPLIYSGETIIIRKQDFAESGDVVVALVDNEDATVKRLKFIEGGLLLEAVNEQYQSLFFSSSQIKGGKVKIIGKAVESRKRL